MVRKTWALLTSAVFLVVTAWVVPFAGQVSISVDGQQHTVTYLGRSVAGVLEAADIVLTSGDTVAPALDADASAAAEIVVHRGQPELPQPVEAVAVAQLPPPSELVKLKGVSMKFSNEGLGLIDGLKPATRDSCIASMYDEPQGTASGERFDPEAMTAAHKTLRLGSRVRVTNPANGKTVLVRINDRGPYIAGRCLDLSRASFRAIGDLGRGLMTVYYEVD